MCWYGMKAQMQAELQSLFDGFRNANKIGAKAQSGKRAKLSYHDSGSGLLLLVAMVMEAGSFRESGNTSTERAKADNMKQLTILNFDSWIN